MWMDSIFPKSEVGLELSLDINADAHRSGSRESTAAVYIGLEYESTAAVYVGLEYESTAAVYVGLEYESTAAVYVDTPKNEIWLSENKRERIVYHCL